ncbi:bifunctional 5,10-methylenetetrahydrofolate dehydrogenase/5,10-methenyltetrahydrofolate cyclohydrolase [Candidatus Palauibacter sp.]|uniref:bifunctional 5,10-methylenetetrahydrofolate dehydrogenase/5,10-methenyltetrahydrofolate cyclohydrolase n=1 Tax=Candidatus Palauibacter sp. TaxID=3101350 RepID=UPI003B0241D2
MTAQLIDGKRIAAEIRAEVAERTRGLSERGIRPGLGVVLVGDDPASHVYVRMKTRACNEAGIHARDITPPADVGRAELLGIVDELNADPAIHGILVQLPLPRHLDEREVTERIDPAKDVDGFHPVNQGRMSQGDASAFRPATPAGVQELIRRTGVETSGAHVVIVGRSNIVGMPMSQIMLQKEPGANATVTVAHSRTADLGAVTRQGEILIVAVGVPGIVRGDMVREGAVVIDVGVNRVDDPTTERGYRLVGDVAFDEAVERASWITPVPGGVGPMTIAMLLRNTVRSAERTARLAAAGTVAASV